MPDALIDPLTSSLELGDVVPIPTLPSSLTIKVSSQLEFSTNNFSKDIIKGWDNPN